MLIIQEIFTLPFFMFLFPRLAFKHDNKFSQKMVQKIIFNLVPMAEAGIAAEMKEAGCGAIMHDGWSKFGTHYVGLFAQYNRKIYQNIGKTVATTMMPTNVLLSMRPMSCVAEEERYVDEDDDEFYDAAADDESAQDEMNVADDPATTFTAEVHANYFKEVMKGYGVDLKKWVVCQVRLQI